MEKQVDIINCKGTLYIDKKLSNSFCCVHEFYVLRYFPQMFLVGLQCIPMVGLNLFLGNWD